MASWNNSTVTLSIKECHQQYLMGIRFAWRETPCAYKNASVYSVENDLPAPPFIERRLLGPVSYAEIQHRVRGKRVKKTNRRTNKEESEQEDIRRTGQQHDALPSETDDHPSYYHKRLHLPSKKTRRSF